jgi:proline iminopeptidase
MFVTVNGARLFFDVVGEKLRIDANNALKERPVMILLHGGPGGEHQALRPMFDRFAERAQLVYLDQRGGGRSDQGTPDAWTLAQWGDDVAGFSQALGIAKPIVLGVSGGSMVAQAYLARHPGHAGAAILVNACARLDREALIAGWERIGGAAAAEAARNMYMRGEPRDLTPFVQHCFPHYSRRAPLATPAASARTSFKFAVSRHFFSGGGEAFRFDFRDKLKSVACPVLAVVGAYDPVTRPEWGQELADALPSGCCEFVRFEDSSHMITSDEPERFYTVVEAFLDRLAPA